MVAGTVLMLLAASFIGTAQAETLLDSGGAQVRFENGHLLIARGSTTLIDVQSFDFNFTPPKSVSPTAASAGGKAALHAFYPSVAQYTEQPGDLPVDIEISAVDGGFRFHAKPEWARNTTIRLRDLDDHFFGVLSPLYPDNQHSPDLRGQVVDVDAQGDPSKYHENFSSLWSAFYMTQHGYASFFDTFGKGRYRLGINGETELYHRIGELDWYVFIGRDGDELLTSYYKVIGAPKAPPLWVMGPMGWRDENRGGAPEIVEDVRHMTELHIPFTSWFVDRPYSDGANEWSKMNFNQKFANPGEWIKKLDHDFDLKFMTWIGPMTFGDTDFPGLLPGAMGYIDLSDPAAVAELERRLKTEQYAYGVRGHKNDRAEEYFPEMERWKDGTRDNESRNKYLYLYAKVTHEILSHTWGDDEVNFARAAFHRTQPYLTAIWGGDVRSSWDGLGCNLANSIRAGFLGFPVWGSDTGGYLDTDKKLGGRIDEELYARWLEWGAWSGLFEIKLDAEGGKSYDRPPWVYGEKLQSAFRAACELRMQLLPYVFSLARTSARHGVLMKPLAYLWPSDPKTFSIADEYLLGPAYLVAPLIAPGGKRSVYLPAGTWYDYYDLGKNYKGGSTIDVTAPFERIPVFVRANSLAVTGTVPIGNQRNWAADAKPALVVHATPGKAGESTQFELVDSFDQNRSKTIELQRLADAIQITAPALGAPGEVLVRCDSAPTATQNGQKVNVTFDAAAHVAHITFAAGEAIALKLSVR